jgi:pSer/pThr/pTyr-binding forkhead associated (FHA) protein
VRLRFRIRTPAADGPSVVERAVDVDAATVTLGRAAGADVELPFRTVSGRHAQVVRGPDGFALVDLGSANGTFLDGRRLRAGEPQPLALGQPFRLADVEVMFEGPTIVEGAIPSESTATLARRLVNDLFGSCRPAELARLLVEGGPQGGRELMLAEVGRSYRVGRAAGCDLVLDDEDVSREHVAFERRWNGVEVRDLGSKNGVELAGRRIEGAARLRDGETVVVGATRLRLDDPEDRYLRQMQDEAAGPGKTFVPDEKPGAPGPTGPRRGSRAPLAIGVVALTVLLAIGGVVLWFLVGG